MQPWHFTCFTYSVYFAAPLPSSLLPAPSARGTTSAGGAAITAERLVFGYPQAEQEARHYWRVHHRHGPLTACGGMPGALPITSTIRPESSAIAWKSRALRSVARFEKAFLERYPRFTRIRKPGISARYELKSCCRTSHFIGQDVFDLGIFPRLCVATTIRRTIRSPAFLLRLSLACFTWV